MEKIYNPQNIESKHYANWEKKNYFSPHSQGNPYCIMIPPPNVTGTLHMGHGFNNTIMDTMIRYHRMRGDNTLWQPGTDHAGIATQMVVERQLAAEGKTRHDLGREAFIDRVWTWKEESGGTITKQLRRLGASYDWSRERFTMDEGLSEAVQETFIKLYEDGLIYRGKRLVNWDSVLHTAVSDLEVLSEEEQGSLWYFNYPLTDGSGHLSVATTRPETMLGDAAVAVHPEDERYLDLIGKTVTLPLVGREIPIIADDYVDKDFGTGCVKITPAHDFNDYEMGKRHHLPMINILTFDAKINDEAPERYQGLDRYDARQKIVDDLEKQGLLDSVKPHKLMVPRGDRSGSVIEPMLTNQWYVKMEPLAEPAIKAVQDGRISFVPANWDKTYYNWLTDIQDWCISRQIWWGHRIPAWYDESGQFYVGRSEEEVRQKHGITGTLTQDNDVLDTWFSSALWPFSTLGWPENTKALSTFYPTSVLVTGFDIIFFWVARMIMMGLYFMDEVPFKDIYIHGLVRDGQGQKMSKSKGNVLDPIDIIDGIELEALVAKRTANMMQDGGKVAKIEKATRQEFPKGIAPHGTDALRFTFASLASNGRDINFDMGRVEGYRNFCNKIWNASRYVMMQCEDQDTGLDNNAESILSLADKWIISRLQQVEAKVIEHFDNYRFDLASSEMYEFMWNEYCDWYLELSKPILYSDTATDAEKRGTRRTLVRVLETTLRLMHPIMPFITEELWLQIKNMAGAEGDSIMLSSYPVSETSKIDEESIRSLEWVKNVILGVRRIRGEMDIPPSKELSILLADGNDNDKSLLIQNEAFLLKLAKLDAITWLEDSNDAPESAVSLVGNMKVLIPLAGLIDVEAELARLTKAIEKIDKEITALSGRLSNEGFVNNAPPAVVEKERTRLTSLTSDLENLTTQKTKIETM